ncbi:MAG: MFS transporter [Gordonia sp. (in: high G+C Gram-positive bacteria)]
MPVPDGRTPLARRTQRVTLAVACAATAMLMLDIAVVNTAMPAIAREFTADLSALKWMVDGYTLALAATVLSAGAWADRVGRRFVFVVGALIFTVASAVCAGANGMVMLNVARVVQGFGAALLFATSLALIAAAFPGRARAGALAAYGATIGASFAVGPLLGGMLTEWFDWRAVFLINIPVGIAMLAGVRWVRESRSASPRRGDWGGQLSSTVALAALTYGLITAAEDGWTADRTLFLFCTAGLAALVFVLVEATTPEPMLPLKLFATPAFAGAQLSTFAISASLFAVFVYLGLYLQGVLGMSPIAAGLVGLPGTFVMLIVAGVTDKMMSRVPAWILVSVAMVAVAGGLVVMTTAAAVDASGWAMVPGFMLSCVGAGVFNPVLSAVVLAESGSDDVGLATGVNDVFRQSGIALGVAALGAVFPAHGALSGGSPDAFVDGLRTALWISVAVAAAGAVIAVLMMRAATVTPPPLESDLDDEWFDDPLDDAGEPVGTASP